MIILEIGGGTGIHAEHFMKKEEGKVKKFFFSDLSENMLDVARIKLKRYADKIEFCSFAAEEFEMEQKFDCIYVSGAMHHFVNPEKAIANCKEHLKDGGIMIICEPIVTNPVGFAKVIFKKEEYGQFKTTRRNISNLMKSKGFKITENKVLHYRSNHKIFRWIKSLERFRFMDWSAVMYILMGEKYGD